MIQAESDSGRPATLTKFDRMIAPNATLNTMLVVSAASTNEAVNVRQSRRRRKSAMTHAPTAPMPPASFGVNAPT